MTATLFLLGICAVKQQMSVVFFTLGICVSISAGGGGGGSNRVVDSNGNPVVDSMGNQVVKASQMTDTPTNDLTNVDFAPTGTPITTGASPVTADASVRFYAITSGRTGGVEVINVPNPALPLGDFANALLIGSRIIFYLETQTDPADVVHVTIAGDGAIYTYCSDPVRPTQYLLIGPVVLDFVGAMACFVWCGEAWKIDVSLTEGSDDSVFVSVNYDILVPDASGTDNGGRIHLRAGNAAGAEPGGDLILEAGTSGGAAAGNVMAPSLPTADPHVAGALWNNSGVLHVSAG